MPNISREIKHGSDVEKAILREIDARVNEWKSKVDVKLNKWREAEEKVLAFIPDTDVSRARKAARAAGQPDYTNIMIPYSYAVVMAAHTYLTSVFLARNPVLQFSGRHGESQQQVQAVEALIDYQVLNGYILPYFYTWLYDGLKYGQGIVGTYWEERIDMVTEIIEQPVMDEMGVWNGKTEKIQIPTPVRTYAGNRAYNIQPQHFIWDVTLPLRDFQRGSFAGRKILLKWNEIVRGKKRGYYINTEFLPRKGQRGMIFSDEGSSQLERPSSISDTDAEARVDKASFGASHPMNVDGIELVIEIIPAEWRLGASDWPEKWVFVCTEDLSVLLSAAPLGAFHCQYPYNVIPLEPEGYGLTTRGLPEILEPVQNTVDWLLNSHFWNIRAALNNKFLVDPSKVVMKDVLSTLPGGIVRLKPSAYGTDPKMAMQQFQVADVTQNHLTNFQMMIGIGERVGGVNDQIMGMLDTGGRKTATEVRTSTSFGVNRLKTMSEFASTCGVDPFSRMLVQNSQQYYDMELKFKIVGDLMMNAGSQFMMVTPDTIAGYYDFVNVDGTLPIDRFAQVNLWKDLFQAILAVPMIGMQYDLAGIFQWVAQLAGLRNITQFKLQLRPDEQLALMAQAGNVVPLKPGGPSGGAKRPTSNQLGYQQPVREAMQPSGAPQ